MMVRAKNRCSECSPSQRRYATSRKVLRTTETAWFDDRSRSTILSRSPGASNASRATADDEIIEHSLNFVGHGEWLRRGQTEEWIRMAKSNAKQSDSRLFFFSTRTCAERLCLEGSASGVGQIDKNGTDGLLTRWQMWGGVESGLWERAVLGVQQKVNASVGVKNFLFSELGFFCETRRRVEVFF